MPKYKTEVNVPVAVGAALAACQAAVAELRWKVEEQSDRRLVCKELQQAMLASSTWSAKIEINLREMADGTRVGVEASNFGFGPIQSRHVKGQAGAFCNQLQVVLNRQASAVEQPRPTAGLSEELQRMASLRDNGILSQSEFEAAKAKLLAR